MPTILGPVISRVMDYYGDEVEPIQRTVVQGSGALPPNHTPAVQSSLAELPACVPAEVGEEADTTVLDAAIHIYKAEPAELEAPGEDGVQAAGEEEERLCRPRLTLRRRQVRQTPRDRGVDVTCALPERSSNTSGSMTVVTTGVCLDKQLEPTP